MKALSVKQFWASYIAGGLKTVECRSWPTKYRGELLICSSKGDLELEIEDSHGNPIEPGLILPGGMALGVVELTDCKRMTKADLEFAYLPEEWEIDALKGYAWHMKPLYEVIPVPVKGKLGIYNLDIQLTKLPPQFVDHTAYLDFQKYGRFRLPEWENKLE